MTFLSRIHRTLRLARLTKHGATHRAEDVPWGEHKVYERMPLITLPEPQKLDTTLADALRMRRSAISGNPAQSLLLDELGTLFGLSLRKRPNSIHRNYPSGGTLFPIETYLISAALETQTPAVFHYNPTKHALERLWDMPVDFFMKDIARLPEAIPLSSLIVFTSVWRRSFAKYGDLSYLHAVLEAGHMSENILLVGSALGLQVRPYAGFNDMLVAQLLGLDENEEQAVHSITLCKGSSAEGVLHE